MAKKLKFTSGNASIEMDDTVSELVEKAIRASHGALLDSISDTVEAVHAEALTEWPVKSGKSAKALDWEMRVSENTIQGSISNDVDYVYYIKGNNQAGKSTWQELIIKPTKKAAKNIAIDASEEIAKKVS